MISKLSILATASAASLYDSSKSTSHEALFFRWGTQSADCQMCQRTMNSIFQFYSVFQKDLEWMAGRYCTQVGYKDEKTCYNMMEQLGDTLMYSMINPKDGAFSNSVVCSQMLGVCDKPSEHELSLTDYEKRLAASKPEHLWDNNFVQGIYDKIAASKANGEERDIIRVLQLADPHMDKYYAEGGIINCDGQPCCRADSKVRSGETPQFAGKWGHVSACDPPQLLLENLLEFVRDHQDELKTEAIIWTGDNAPHVQFDKGEINDETVAEYTVNISRIMMDTLRGQTKLDALDYYPVLGNHDKFPSNVEDFTRPYASGAINNIYEHWRTTGWFNDDEAELFHQWGYYAKPLRLAKSTGSTSTNVTVLALNMDACNIANWDLAHGRSDPGRQIQWLEEKLDEIEKDGKLAWIVGHIDTNECLHQFGRRLQALHDRYQHVIRFSVYGHTHTEEFRVVKSVLQNGKNKGEAAIGQQFIGGSITTWTGNPAFTVIDIDAEYMVPVNTHTYVFEIDAANKLPAGEKPQWKEMHDFLKEYNLTDFSPSSLTQLAGRLCTDGDLASQYRWNMYRHGFPKPGPVVNDRYLCCQTESETYAWHDCLGDDTTQPFNFPDDLFKRDFLDDATQQKMMEWLIGNWVDKSA